MGLPVAKSHTVFIPPCKAVTGFSRDDAIDAPTPPITPSCAVFCADSRRFCVTLAFRVGVIAFRKASASFSLPFLARRL